MNPTFRQLLFSYRNIKCAKGAGVRALLDLHAWTEASTSGNTKLAGLSARRVELHIIKTQAATCTPTSIVTHSLGRAEKVYHF